ncbi:DUF2971 domain-containing protein [Vibrio porteresiae]|uniref:DUF2971 domain-containing protein n=1 Tax=Vibrio porteresiae DSM 19223 TaxID=1123496 RepID=A0ABZ0Q9C0_9VIBR|nr:DUF2971 domain-containing protein [Vibrio porteresiae]WPC73048.1 DUF2971 domain-containing protein [Vibrio porteresiae DSM 19223]
MSIIYHYSDLNGFTNIIKNKKLWLSATNNLNDYREVNWFVDKVYNRLKELVNEKNQKLLNKFWQLKSINSPMPYVCSFSKNGDLLSQWRAYADDGYGIAIGFNREFFDFKVDIPSPNALSKYSIGMSDVIYDVDAQEKEIENILSLILSSLKDQDNEDNYLISAVTVLNKLSYICKNDAFSEEDEVRIVHTPLITGDKEGLTYFMGNISDMQHRVSGQTLTSYFELDFSETKDVSPISEIILGPKCKVSQYDMDTFLSMNGFGKVKYKFSTASYR